jgi:single-strand DNA-binding protein
VKNGTFVGRLGNNAETRSTNDGQPVTNFSIAVDRPKKNGDKQQPLWVKAAFWGKRGEAVAQYLTKGSKVAISGDIDLETYNSNGETKTQLVCRVNDLTLLGDGQKSEEPAAKEKEYAF